MNSEEIKEIGQMFLNIQNNGNGHAPVSVTPEQLNEEHLTQVSAYLRDCLCFVDWDALDKSEVMLCNKMTDLYALKDDERRKRAEKAREEILNRVSMLEEEYKMDVKRIRGDYRSLQNEMWERFDLVEQWILSDTSKEKQKLKDDIIDVREEHEKQKNYTMFKAEKKVTPLDLQHTGNPELKYAPPAIWNTSIRHIKSKQGIPLSIRSTNTLWDAKIRSIGELVQKAPSELLKIKNFGRKCLNDVKKTLEDHDLSLNMEKEEELRAAKKNRIIEMFKL